MQKMTQRFTDELRRLQHENHDNCTSCNYSFKAGDTTNLGYDEDDNPLYVCDDCSHLIKETAAKYHFTPRPYELPGSDKPLWRYMDFTKYVSLLSTKCLFFPRADKLGDPFEGAKGLKIKKGEWDEFYLEFFKETLRNPPTGHERILAEDKIDDEARRLLRELEQGGEYKLRTTYISCWHENKFESEAMWRLYSSYIDNAIAIKSSFSRLYESLGKKPSIYIGRVKYVNYNEEFAGPNEAFWRKRKSFEHENEVRALAFDFYAFKDGLCIPCDINRLMEKVLVSPTSPDWFLDLVMNVSIQYDVKVEVSRSELAEEPFF